MIAIHRNGNLYSAATSLQVIAINTSFELLADMLVECVEDLTLEEAYTLIQNGESDPQTWKATISSATANGILLLEEQSEALAAATDSELVAIKEQLAKSVAERDKSKEIDSLRQTIRDRETSVRDALIRQFGPDYNEYWVRWSTRFERQRLEELEEINNG